MSGCNGKCSSCGPTDCEPQGYTLTYSKKPIFIEASELLKSPPKQKADGSSLNNKCEHYPYGTVPRYQCEECIQEWVEAKEDHQINSQIEVLYKNQKKVAAERMQVAWKEKQHKRRIS